MHQQYRTKSLEEQGLSAIDREVAGQLVERLDQFLAPLLVVLDAYLDKRLVRTVLDLVVSLIQLRHRQAGTLLSELGAMLLSPQQAPAGSKRIDRLLHSPKWGAWLIEQFLWRRAQQQLQTLENRGELALILHDGSEIEKPESVCVQGLCPVRSAKGRRLSRPRPAVHCVSPTAGAPILVPGIHWHAAVLIGLKGLPCVAKMRYWTSRGARASRGRVEEERMLSSLAHPWGRRVIHVFDRGWAGGPWLQVLDALRQRFVERWTSRSHLLDAHGVQRKAWEIARGKRDSFQGKLWWAKFGREIRLSIKVRAVGHPDLPGTGFFLVVESRQGVGEPVVSTYQ
jgi:hypothetical protein